MRLAAVHCFIMVLLLWATVAHADTNDAVGDRYALVVGNNVGDGEEPTLRYAEADAARIAELLVNFGRFAPENVVLLLGQDANAVRTALIEMNARMRGVGRTPSVLVTYYSGHADAEQLHLGATSLRIRELESLTSGAAAAFRLLILDACRSLRLTRDKGASPGAPFSPIGLRTTSQGTVVWSAAALGEAAQESDDLGASFFTHALISGMMGGADSDNDAHVDSEEAFRYAADRTLQATQKTLSGPQHATFRDMVQGQDRPILSYLGGRGLTSMTLPPGAVYLISHQGLDGRVVAEADARTQAARIWVKPGRYRIVGRGRDVLLEGEVDTVSQAHVLVNVDAFDRTVYARLVRKGANDRSVSMGPQVLAAVRTPLLFGDGPCLGAQFGLPIEWRWLTVEPRVHGCRAVAANNVLKTNTDEFGGLVRAVHVFDFAPIALLSRLAPSLDVGLTGGVSFFRQSFAGDAATRDRLATTLAFGTSIATSIELGHGFQLRTELEGRTYVFRYTDGTDDEIRASSTGLLSFGVGTRF